jgi:hypothetical protein
MFPFPPSPSIRLSDFGFVHYLSLLHAVMPLYRDLVVMRENVVDGGRYRLPAK